MREFPLFVPFGREHLAAVATLPDEEPTGLVLLATGTGAPRSHRFQLWTTAARRLADQGLATVRMDYLGIGDSTGRVMDRNMGELGQRMDEAVAVARFAMRAMGTERLAVLGNCSGGLVVLGAAARLPTCIGTVCVLPRVLQPTGINRMVIGMRGSRLASMVRSNALLRRLLGPLKGRKGKARSLVRDSMGVVLEHGRLLFVYSKQDTDAYNERSRTQLKRILGALPAESRGRFELRILPDGPLAGFESIQVQRAVIDTVVDWMIGCFGLTRPDRSELERGMEASSATAP
jgi:pimeloyl-ACP methyl ester carboxylesterase